MSKRFMLLGLMLLILSLSCSYFAYAAENDEKSIGTTAGSAARNLQDKTAENAKVVAAETEKASKQFAQIADETFRNLNIQAQEALKSFQAARDRKSTRLNSSHSSISYAVF